MKKIAIGKIFGSFLAFIFAISCFDTTYLVLALNDCGTHEVVSCNTHDDAHFVARHVSDNQIASKKSFTKESLNYSSFPEEEHDAAHQIEKSSIAITTASFSSFEYFELSSTDKDYLAEVKASLQLLVVKYPNAPPILESSYLRFLPSVLLQV